jgi:queuine tRNA-ribosyltransferase
MGVGLPENLLETIALGIDMFDCVLPTRNARHGLLYTNEGVINIKNARWKDDLEAIDPSSNSPYSRDHSKAYLHHLFRVREHYGSTIASVHNLSFFVNLVKQARAHIIKGDFTEWKDKKVKELVVRL